MRALRFLAFLLPLVLAATVVDALMAQLVHSVRVFDPFLLVAVWFGAHGRRLEGMIAGGVAGIVQDAALSQRLGTHYLAKLVVGYLTTLMSGKLIPGQPTTHGVLIAAGSVVQSVVLVAEGFLLGQDLAPASFAAVALQVAGNVVVGVAAFALVERVRRRRSRSMVHGPRGR